MFSGGTVSFWNHEELVFDTTVFTPVKMCDRFDTTEVTVAEVIENYQLVGNRVSKIIASDGTILYDKTADVDDYADDVMREREGIV